MRSLLSQRPSMPASIAGSSSFANTGLFSITNPNQMKSYGDRTMFSRLVGSRRVLPSAGAAGAPCRLSQLPAQRPVGLVAAKGSRVDRVLEVPRERRVLLPDPLDALADAAGDGLARPVARVRCLARPA